MGGVVVLETRVQALAQDTQDQAAKSILEDEVAIASANASLGKTKEAREQLRSVAPRARSADVSG